MQPWHTFIGEMKSAQFYNRPLTPEEIMGKYLAERQP